MYQPYWFTYCIKKHRKKLCSTRVVSAYRVARSCVVPFRTVVEPEREEERCANLFAYKNLNRYQTNQFAFRPLMDAIIRINFKVLFSRSLNFAKCILFFSVWVGYTKEKKGSAWKRRQKNRDVAASWIAWVTRRQWLFACVGWLGVLHEVLPIWAIHNKKNVFKLNT
jgi:hypothetical protein